MISNTMLNNFRKDFANAVSEIEKKYGIKINLGRILYSSQEFSCKLTAVNVEDMPFADNRTIVYVSDFLKNYSWYNLEKTDIYKFITYRNKNLKFVGTQSRRTKYPLVFLDLDTNELRNYREIPELIDAIKNSAVC